LFSRALDIFIVLLILVAFYCCSDMNVLVSVLHCMLVIIFKAIYLLLPSGLYLRGSGCFTPAQTTDLPCEVQKHFIEINLESWCIF